MNRSIPERLAKLHLSGFSNAYMEQLNIEGFQEMSFDDRLSLLLEREELERANKSIALRLGKARFKQAAAIEDLKASAARGLDRSTINTLSNCDFIRQKRNLIITGASGCGKSFLATALSHRACLLGFTARYFRAPSLLLELELARLEGTLHKKIAQLSRINVVIIDDFLLSALNEAE